MSIYEYNGSALIAMAGKECVAIASDTRFGVRNQTVWREAQKIFQINNKTFLGLGGLNTDIWTLKETFRFHHNLYALREERDMSPKVFANLVSHVLYSHRFGPYFVSPIVCGLDDDNVPFLCGTDEIGAQEITHDFIATGTAVESLMGVCETFYKENLEPEDLFETISQCLLAGVDRDCLSGWGAVVHVLTKDGITTRKLKMRQD
ncbi:proteasome subunit beta type-3 [Anaeramoeba ignava]|uniref:Proteasome subunit beta n=1 Tax=Anaeramoeba ignava TaxID=1746090 RepID=A0A9Q0RHM9_ANAIG|nr:proteasome subunit beta type-3 [Anaeramoeba ignava]|eukprot:Anaeramoba_ignava/a352075_220.p1 GENE.a352075_220~~a352075_220.p1  ORF type:complete len:230 (-),score=50.40 a352075_220:154-768(-)